MTASDKPTSENISSVASDVYKDSAAKVRARSNSVALHGDELEKLREENEKLRTALAGVEMLFSREGENATDRYERVADAFFAETGYMRPGKSQPLEVTHSDDERTLIYESWIESKLLVAREVLAALVKKDAARG